LAFRIRAGRPIRRELQRVVRQQLKQACGHLERRAGSHVHEARRCVKKVRAIVVLLRQVETPGLRKDARRLRAVGRTLSAWRDSDVVLDALDRVSRAAGVDVSQQTPSALRRDLTRARTQIVAQVVEDRAVGRAADRLRAVRRSAAEWDLPAIEPDDLPQLVTVAYRRARQAMRCADRMGRASDLHEWRKAVKTVWYALRLLEALAPSVRATIEDLDRLDALLGEHHDLSVLKSTIAKAGPPGSADAERALGGAATALQDAVRRQAITLGRRVLAEKPRVFAHTLGEALSDG